MRIKTKWIAGILTVILLALCCIMLILIPRSHTAKAAELNTEMQFREEYSVGDWLEIPKGTLMVDGNAYVASSAVCFPDGTTSRKNGFLIEQAGIYTVRYFATVDGKVYSESVTVTATEKNVAGNAVIRLDFGSYSETELPNALVGEPYPIFAATASVSGKSVPVKTEVFYSYGHSSQMRIETKDGSFTPDRTGTYEIVYTATNFFGKEEKKSVLVAAVDRPNELALSLANGSFVAGKNGIFDFSGLSNDVRFGKLFLTVTARQGDGAAIEIYSGEFSSSTIVSYVFEKTGDYAIEWTLFDYVRSVSGSSGVTVTAPAAVFETSAEKLGIEPVFLAGKTYRIPDLASVSYGVDGLIRKVSEKSVAYGGGESTLMQGDILNIPDAPDADSVTIFYRSGTLTDSVTVPIRTMEKDSDGKLETEKLVLLGNGQNATRSREGIRFELGVAKTAEYIQKLEASEWSASLVPSDFAANTGFSVQLTDRKQNAVTVNFIVKADSVEISVTGIVAKQSLVYEPSGTLSLEYSERNRSLRVSSDADEDTANFDLKNLDGFNGFAESYAYLKLETTAGKGTILLNRLNGTLLDGSMSRYTAPTVVLSGAYGTNGEIGNDIVTVSAFGLHVIDGYLPATISITDENGNYVKLEDGTEVNRLDAQRSYRFKLSVRGKYRIAYESVDSANWSGSKIIYIRAIGTQAPELSVGEITQRVARVGETLILPEFTATDALGGNVEMFAVVFSPDGTGEMATDAYIFRKEGSYKVVLAALDPEGNLSTDYYYVEVVA